MCLHRLHPRPGMGQSSLPAQVPPNQHWQQLGKITQQGYHAGCSKAASAVMKIAPRFKNSGVSNYEETTRLDPL